MSLILESQRLLLKPILHNQLNILHSIFIDPYVRKYLCDDHVFSLQQVENMLKEIEKFDEQKIGLWFIETKDEQKIIGFVGLWYFFAGRC